VFVSAVISWLVGCGWQGNGYAPSRVAGGPESAPYASYAQAPEEATPGLNREQYDPIVETGLRSTLDEPLSTFSVDVDTASYANVRRFLRHEQLPPPDAVRIEELINYFDYDCGPPDAAHPLAIATELSESPFHADRKLLRVGLRAVDPEAATQPARNLVFLIDVSGSMQDAEKLPLLKHALTLLVEQLGAQDTLSMVVYAGASGVVLPPTRGDDRRAIVGALDGLEAGGSTNGGAGIELAYQLAHRQARAGAINRVILATDGDFNVGISDRGSLLRLIEARRDLGVFLTVLGFGMGNLQDATLELLADHGNGNYAYIDSAREAEKVLVREVGSTLRTVAKDTKIQIEFNPARVARYRLIGYENRRLEARDFNDDAKDAGDMGDGDSVTALYELGLVADGHRPSQEVDPLRYQGARGASADQATELLTLKVRYKTPAGEVSQLLSRSVSADALRPFASASEDLRFGAAVAGFGMLLRSSPQAGRLDLAQVARIARDASSHDPYGYRAELVELVGRARELGLAARATH
jgi:Ca-activated chloride channel family protein